MNMQVSLLKHGKPWGKDKHRRKHGTHQTGRSNQHMTLEKSKRKKTPHSKEKHQNPCSDSIWTFLKPNMELEHVLVEGDSCWKVSFSASIFNFLGLWLLWLLLLLLLLLLFFSSRMVVGSPSFSGGYPGVSSDAIGSSAADLAATHWGVRWRSADFGMITTFFLKAYEIWWVAQEDELFQVPVFFWGIKHSTVMQVVLERKLLL